jgi:hypothetical protein
LQTHTTLLLKEALQTQNYLFIMEVFSGIAGWSLANRNVGQAA